MEYLAEPNQPALRPRLRHKFNGYSKLRALSIGGCMQDFLMMAMPICRLVIGLPDGLRLDVAFGFRKRSCCGESRRASSVA